jgi:glycosyltransferase involved in cell wall biosynthesis
VPPPLEARRRGCLRCGRRGRRRESEVRAPPRPETKRAALRICFYAAVKDRRLFDLIEFYRQDIRSLEALGHDVRKVNDPRDLSWRDDLYWVWWQTSGLPAVLWGKARRRPCVLVTALSDRDRSACGPAAKPPLVRRAARVSLAAADLVLAVSEETRLGLTAYRTRRLRAAPLGVDTDFYRPAPAPRASEPFVLTISHLNEENVQRKRLLDVVRAAALLPDRSLRFVIAGKPDRGAAIVEAEIQRLGAADRVSLIGEISPDEKLSLMQRAAVYLQPTEHEAFGMAIAEAMACATPVLSHAAGNVPDLVGDAGVLLPPSAAADELAASLTELLARSDREQLGRRARTRVLERFPLSRRREVVAAALADLTGSAA